MRVYKKILVNILTQNINEKKLIKTHENIEKKNFET